MHGVSWRWITLQPQTCKGARSHSAALVCTAQLTQQVRGVREGVPYSGQFPDISARVALMVSLSDLSRSVGGEQFFDIGECTVSTERSHVFTNTRG